MLRLQMGIVILMLKHSIGGGKAASKGKKEPGE